jgi:diguanylate cyclase (GGDEF)-like protein
MNMASGVPSLDIFSVKAMARMTMLVVSLVALSAWRFNQRIAGMCLFTTGLLALSFGELMGIAPILIHGNAIVVVSNVLVLGGMITVVQSVRIFRGLPALPRITVVGFVAAISVFYFCWMFVDDGFDIREGITSAVFTLLSIDAAVSMIRRVSSGDRLIYWPTGFAFVFAAAYLAVRTIVALSGAYGARFLSPVPVELASSICDSVAYIWCVFGMLIASNAQLRREAEKMALIDPLTNLPNRRSFLDRLLAAENRALATNQKFGLIYLDLDEFKLINDMLGHYAGDVLLRSISATITRILRSGDCLGRIGGDEFMVLVEDVQTRREIEGLAERLKTTVENAAVSVDFVAPVRVSCGVAMFPDDDGCSAHDAMREADAAMYRAKRQSRTAEKTELAEFGHQSGQIESIGAHLNENLAANVSFRRRRSDQWRKAQPQPKRDFWRSFIMLTLRPDPASPRVSWAKPLSWIGY